MACQPCTSPRMCMVWPRGGTDVLAPGAPGGVAAAVAARASAALGGRQASAIRAGRTLAAPLCSHRLDVVADTLIYLWHAPH